MRGVTTHKTLKHILMFEKVANLQGFQTMTISLSDELTTHTF